jgi:uncharacterized membrane protein YgaE (UPF0421/DUF939 family)
MSNKKILWVVAVVMGACSLGMQIPDFDSAFQQWFTAISGVLAILFASSTLPKVGDKYLSLIKLLMEASAKLIFWRKKQNLEKKDENKSE